MAVAVLPVTEPVSLVLTTFALEFPGHLSAAHSAADVVRASLLPPVWVRRRMSTYPRSNRRIPDHRVRGADPTAAPARPRIFLRQAAPCSTTMGGLQEARRGLQQKQNLVWD